MSSYAQRLAERLAQQAQATPTPAGAAQRLEVAGNKVGVPLPELLAWYASDLDAIEHDGEITDAVLLAFVEDYARKHRPKLQAQKAGGGVLCAW